MSSKVFIVVPTFRETEKVGSLLQSVRHLHHRPLELVVVNADPGDATSQLLAREAKHGDLIIHEEPGIPEQFWSGTVNRGLRRVARRSRSGDWVLLMNVDVIFHNDIVGALLHAALRRSPCQIGAVAHARGNVISSGVQVKSWMLTLNRHPLAGLREGHIPKGVCIPVDFLPTRCLLFPADALKNVGLVQERRLPHYGADYEFSLRLARHGYAAFLLG